MALSDDTNARADYNIPEYSESQEDGRTETAY